MGYVDKLSITPHQLLFFIRLITMTPDTTVPTGPLRWSDAFLLGFSPMDAMHEEFVDLLGQLQCAEDSALPTLLNQFTEHLQRHFDLENGWMTESEFPPRDCHIDEHAAVMKSVKEVQCVLAQGEYAVCRKLIDALVDWFPSHADHLDSALAHWLTKQRLGGKPVVLRRGLNLR